MKRHVLLRVFRLPPPQLTSRCVDALWLQLRWPGGAALRELLNLLPTFQKFLLYHVKRINVLDVVVLKGLIFLLIHLMANNL